MYIIDFFFEKNNSLAWNWWTKCDSKSLNLNSIPNYAKAIPPTETSSEALPSANSADEIIADYIKALNLPKQRILIMAEGGSQKVLQSRLPWLIDACKKHGLRYTPRLQIDIWNEVTGVWSVKSSKNPKI